MVALIITAVVAQAAWGPAPRGALILEGRPLDTAVVNARAKLDATSLDGLLRVNGYATFVAHGVDVYVCPDLWQAAKMKASLDSYGQLEAALRPDGTVDLKKVPALDEVAANLAAYQGYGFDGDGTVLLLVRSYNIQVGGRSLSLSASARSDHGASGVPSRKLQPLDTTQPARVRERAKQSLEHIPQVETSGLTSADFYCYFGLAANRKAQAQGFRDAIDAVARHEKAYEDARYAKPTELNDRIGGFHVEDYYGKSFSDLPTSLQSQIAGDYYKAYGFNSSSDFAAWLRQGTLTGSSGHTGLMLGQTSDGVGIGLGIP